MDPKAFTEYNVFQDKVETSRKQLAACLSQPVSLGRILRTKVLPITTSPLQAQAGVHLQPSLLPGLVKTTECKDGQRVDNPAEDTEHVSVTGDKQADIEGSERKLSLFDLPASDVEICPQTGSGILVRNNQILDIQTLLPGNMVREEVMMTPEAGRGVFAHQLSGEYLAVLQAMGRKEAGVIRLQRK